MTKSGMLFAAILLGGFAAYLGRFGYSFNDKESALFVLIIAARFLDRYELIEVLEPFEAEIKKLTERIKKLETQAG